MINLGRFRPFLRISLQQTQRYKFNNMQGPNKDKDALAQRKEEVQLMQDTYEKVKMQGLEDRSITGVNSFQRDILLQNKFDLLNPKVQPKIASLSTTVGLDVNNNNYLTEINLGKIKVKKENQVFLSEVDPFNIPEYYDIVFDYEKEMSLVGKKVEGTKSDQNSEMKISTRKAFQQKSQEQLMKQTFGVRLTYILNSRIVWKHFLIALFLTYFFYSPILQALMQYYLCLESISEIQAERMKHVHKLKRESLIYAIIDNPDMSIN